MKCAMLFYVQYNDAVSQIVLYVSYTLMFAASRFNG